MTSTKNLLAPLGLLFLGLITAMMVVGCGSSTEQFTTTDSQAPDGVGTLTLINLDRIGLPAGTTDLSLFFTSGGASVAPVREITLPFAPTVTVDNVAGDASLVRLTAISANGAPLATATAPVSVLPGGNRVVDLSGTTVVLVGVTASPIVTLNQSVLDYGRDDLAKPLDPTATVTYAGADVGLVGGILTVRSSTDDLRISGSTGGAEIGAVIGNGTRALTVALDDNVTLSKLISFLGGVRISTSGGTATFGQRIVTVTLADSQGRTGSNSRPVNVQGPSAVTREVGTSGATDGSIQDAINFIEASSQGGGSKILVGSGSYLAEGIITISNDPDLAGLTLEGPNVNISAGNLPEARVAPARVAAFMVNHQVVIDGFDIEGANIPAADGEAGVFFGPDASNSVIRNTSLINAPAAPAGRGVTNEAGGNCINLTITSNRFEGWSSGTFLQGNPDGTAFSTGNLIQGNLFDRNAGGSRNIAVQDCQFLDNTYGVATLSESLGFSRNGRGNHVHGNDFLPSNAVNIYGAGNANVNVRSNWWGQATGPLPPQINAAGGGPGTVNNSSDFLTADPFPTQP